LYLVTGGVTLRNVRALFQAIVVLLAVGVFNIGHAPPAKAVCSAAGRDSPCCDTGYGPEQSDPRCRTAPGETDDFIALIFPGLLVLTSAGLIYAGRQVYRLKDTGAVAPR
jgi:hypothetical protein